MDVKEESGVVICQTPDKSHFKTMEYFKPFIISQYGNSEAGAGVGSVSDLNSHPSSDQSHSSKCNFKSFKIK